MSRCIMTKDVTIAASGYTQPERKLRKGQVVELSASEVTTIGGTNLRTVNAIPGTASHTHDTLGESFAVSNSSS
jgi:hypothetical protein